ncbi:MAG: M28 family peptidase [Croceivirga sp.]
MKQLVIILIASLLSCNANQKTTEQIPKPPKQEKDPIEFAETITEEELKDYLFTYASDEFEGRETGKPGQKKAIEFITLQYEKLGIPALKSDGDYLQKVSLSKSNVPDGKITVNDIDFIQGEDFLSFSEGTGKLDEVVYVGYGISEEGYDDYARIEVKDKMVLMKFGEPTNADGSYILSGNNEKSVWSNMSESLEKRTKVAKARGAKGIFYYDPQNYSRYKRYYDYMKTNSSERIQLNAEKETNFMVLVNQSMGKKIFPELNAGDTPKVIKTSLELKIQNTDDQIDSENVVAIIKGTEKPDEYLVISSHLDHIGVNKDGQINNGADDDGSGTVAMLEIAQAFKMAADEGVGPNRSIIFLHVTGEEKGLLGSKYYTDYNPLVPLKNTIANLNIDMIGRIDPKRQGDRNYIYLIGSDKLSTELHELSETVNSTYTNLELDYKYNDENDPNRFYYRSDHYNFAKNNIPIIFYFNGTHPDYHQPGDTADKINYDLLQKRSQLIFHTAWEVANREKTVSVDKVLK